jgi:DNA-binding MarR family transcriptional regulator
MNAGTGTLSTTEALRLVVAMHRLLRGLRRAVGVPGPHATQLVVLALLAQHGPLRVGELAARIPCPQPTATLTVSGLRAAGLAIREPDPDDGRASRVAITPEGQRVLESVAQGEARELAGLLGTADEADLALLRAAIPLLGGLADAAMRQQEQAST